MGGCSATPLPRSLPEGPWRRRLRALPAENLHALRQEGLVASRGPHPGTPARRPGAAAARRGRRRTVGGAGQRLLVLLPGTVAARASAGARRRWPLQPGPVRPAAQGHTGRGRSERGLRALPSPPTCRRHFAAASKHLSPRRDLVHLQPHLVPSTAKRERKCNATRSPSL